MIQRSGLSARSRLPISAATSLTCSMFFLSSVSGMVKNCGAWGSMAPPMTVDLMAGLSFLHIPGTRAADDATISSSKHGAGIANEPSTTTLAATAQSHQARLFPRENIDENGALLL